MIEQPSCNLVVLIFCRKVKGSSIQVIERIDIDPRAGKAFDFRQVTIGRGTVQALPFKPIVIEGLHDA